MAPRNLINTINKLSKSQNLNNNEYYETFRTNLNAFQVLTTETINSDNFDKNKDELNGHIDTINKILYKIYHKTDIEENKDINKNSFSTFEKLYKYYITERNDIAGFLRKIDKTLDKFVDIIFVLDELGIEPDGVKSSTPGAPAAPGAPGATSASRAPAAPAALEASAPAAPPPQPEPKKKQKHHQYLLEVVLKL